jgi:hypothetical protein
MAANNPPPPVVGAAPEPYNGAPEKALAFWNTLASYYTSNADRYATESIRVAAALSHFKIGTPAGEWASDLMAAALRANPVTYGTWNAFKTAFETQFIPPTTTLDAIAGLHNTSMGSQDFNVWYQRWSEYARRSGVDEATKMYAFRRMINPRLHDKITMLSPQPDTLAGLVEKARDLDKSWRMFTRTSAGPPRRGNPRIRELAEQTAEAEINATQGRRAPFKKRGKLTQQERQHRMDNNLCLYCGKSGHRAIDCIAMPNKNPRPKTQLRQIDTIPDDGTSAPSGFKESPMNSIATSDRYAAIKDSQVGFESEIQNLNETKSF